MKKIAIITLVLFSFSLQSCQKEFEDKLVNFSELPEKAKETVNLHFSDLEISYVLQEGFLCCTSYEVVFSNGTELKFSRKGEWEEIDCKTNAVPLALIPQEINDHVTRQHPGQYVIKIEHERKHYDIKLDNQLEITFGSDFRIIGYDN